MTHDDYMREALEGRRYAPLDPAEAVSAGVVLTSEDRRTSGIVSGHSAIGAPSVRW